MCADFLTFLCDKWMAVRLGVEHACACACACKSKRVKLTAKLEGKKMAVAEVAMSASGDAAQLTMQS